MAIFFDKYTSIIYNFSFILNNIAFRNAIFSRILNIMVDGTKVE